MYVCIYVYMYVCLYVYMYMNENIYVCTFVNMYTNLSHDWQNSRLLIGQLAYDMKLY